MDASSDTDGAPAQATGVSLHGPDGDDEAPPQAVDDPTADEDSAHTMLVIHHGTYEVRRARPPRRPGRPDAAPA